MDSLEAKVSIIIAVVVLFLIIGIPIVKNGNRQDVSFTVKDKTVTVSKSKSKYLIFTDKGVYENADSLLQGKWDSSDMYNSLEIGKQYKVEVRGYRIPFLSMYQNIIRVE